MQTTRPRHLHSVLFEDDRCALIETPEHEVLDIEGCSREELDAKLHDLEAWAS